MLSPTHCSPPPDIASPRAKSLPLPADASVAAQRFQCQTNNPAGVQEDGCMGRTSVSKMQARSKTNLIIQLPVPSVRLVGEPSCLSFQVRLVGPTERSAWRHLSVYYYASIICCSLSSKGIQGWLCYGIPQPTYKKSYPTNT